MDDEVRNILNQINSTSVFDMSADNITTLAVRIDHHQATHRAGDWTTAEKLPEIINGPNVSQKRIIFSLC